MLYNLAKQKQLGHQGLTVFTNTGCIYAYYLLPSGEGCRAKAKEVVLQAKAKCETEHEQCQ